MMPRTCIACGVPEHRWTDGHGKPMVNINPLTGECVACLAKSAREHPLTLFGLFDQKLAAAGTEQE